MLAGAALTAGEPDGVGATAEGLTDGRVRLVFYGEVVTTRDAATGQPTTALAPYLMLLHSPEARKSTWLLRQDVHLALG